MTAAVIKLCGIRTPADARLCAEAGATELGVVFAPGSKRRVTPEEARAIRAAIPAGLPLIGVFQDASLASLQAALGAVGLTALQLHGALPGGLASLGVPLHRALQVSDDFPQLSDDFIDGGIVIEPGGAASPRFARLLLDGPQGGSGRPFAWERLPSFRARFSAARAVPLHLAGGLRADNVAAAIALVRPDGVDVSSGIEGPDGFKDPARVRAFVAAARAAFSAASRSSEPSEPSEPSEDLESSNIRE